MLFLFVPFSYLNFTIFFFFGPFPSSFSFTALPYLVFAPKFHDFLFYPLICLCVSPEPFILLYHPSPTLFCYIPLPYLPAHRNPPLPLIYFLSSYSVHHLLWFFPFLDIFFSYIISDSMFSPLIYGPSIYHLSVGHIGL